MAVGKIGYSRKVREMVLVKRADRIGHGDLSEERFVILFFEIVQKPFPGLFRKPGTDF
jgi:hypothetical protein